MFVVIGTATVDLFISGMKAMPRLDGDEFTTASLVFCDEPLNMTLGGNGANSAYVLASLGALVALCSVTGTNPLGDTVTAWLREKQVDLRGFLQRARGTATTTIAVDNAANRISFYYPGVFSDYGVDDIPRDLLQAASYLLITGYPILPGLRSGGVETIFKIAQENGVQTLLDIGPAIGEPAQLEELKPLLPLVDYLLTNDYELAVCTGQNTVQAGIQTLLNAHARCVIVKQGAEGALAVSQTRSIHAPGFPVDATVTVGAGDSFNAGLMYGLHRAMPLEQALRMANATASLVVQSGKSVFGAPTMEQVEALMS